MYFHFDYKIHHCSSLFIIYLPFVHPEGMKHPDMNTIHMNISLLFESFLKCCGSGIGVCTFNAVLSTLLAVTQHSIFHTVRKVLGCEQSNHKAVMFYDVFVFHSMWGSDLL